ncbi:MAG: hypothetical protein APF84_08245 [Gracilibacter sp. BRH_c7a]|nr:MAG: hypothetical protein APF84_08245 [Gracilibacter sp. BRH_c7a]
MDIIRARQIVASQKNIDVFYKGSFVWIEKLDEHNETADVKNLETHQKVSVPISMLFELY